MLLTLYQLIQTHGSRTNHCGVTLVPVATLQIREGRHRRFGPRRGEGVVAREGAEEEGTSVEGEEEGWGKLAAVQH